MPTDPPLDEIEGIKFTGFAARKLNAIRLQNPSVWARLVQAIRDNVAIWSPGDEDGVTLKHVKTVTDECCHNVYRMKYELHGLVERRWRVFFAFLSLRQPPVRLVLAVVDYQDQESCYKDDSQEHRLEIRRAIEEAIKNGETKKKRKWLII